MVKRFLKGLLASRQNRTITRYYDFVNSLSSLAPELIPDVPPGQNVLVIAPHSDDEALGCGGTLIKHHQAGHKITAVFMTDGSKSESAMAEEKLVRLRKKEGEQAAEILGIVRCIFLNYPDRCLKKNSESVERMRQILVEIQPDLVYLPFYLDNHPDHQATAAIVLGALKQHAVPTVMIYEVWTTLIHNVLVDISTTIDQKVRAIQVYQSQKSIDEFADQMRSLNRFRSLQSGNQFQFAEAFFKIDSGIIDQLLKENF